LVPFQVWLEGVLGASPGIRDAMLSDWGWPIVESIHFIGLTLLFGTIVVWDLRLLGFAKEVPFAAFHRLIPFAVLGFTINATTGTLFLMADADQYVYNPAFHMKMLSVALAGANVAVFYATTFRHVKRLGPGASPPTLTRWSGAISLVLWTVVIVAGRMITFFRPSICAPGEAGSILASCIVR
jgi:hypothetical protein